MSRVTVTIFGDICPTPDYQPLFDNQPGALFADIATLAKETDFAICNLECPATGQTQPIAKAGPNLKASPGILSTLTEAGIQAVSLANNHILDYGEEGVLETLHYAEACGMKHFGGGRNSAEAATPLVVDVRGRKIAFISFAEHEFNLATESTPGANWFDPYKSLSTIARQKATCDYVVVLYHGGIEHYKYPSPLLQKKCRAMVEAGADAVFCQHSHCIGTIETHEGKPIVYGQGNTIFGYRARSKAWNEGLACTLILEPEGVRLESRLLQAAVGSVRLAPAETEQARLAEMAQDSACLAQPHIIRERWLAFCRASEAHVLPNVYGKSRVYNKLNRMLRGGIINLLVSKRKLRTTMAYVRCEAHHEVLTTILEHKTNAK